MKLTTERNMLLKVFMADLQSVLRSTFPINSHLLSGGEIWDRIKDELRKELDSNFEKR